MAHDKKRALAGLRPLGKALWRPHIINIYCNGDGVGFVWVWWNPLAWIVAALVTIITIFMVGVPQAWANKHEFGFGISPYFKANPDRLVWIERTQNDGRC